MVLSSVMDSNQIVDCLVDVNKIIMQVISRCLFIVSLNALRVMTYANQIGLNNHIKTVLHLTAFPAILLHHHLMPILCYRPFRDLFKNHLACAVEIVRVRRDSGFNI